MRAHTILTLIGAMALSASAIAGPAVPPDASGTSVMSVNVPGTAYKLTPAEFNGVAGSYKLANGSTLRVSTSQRKVWAEIDGANKTQLVPVAQNTFVALEDNSKVEFDELPFATNVTLTKK
jgi:hypothetical protein